MAGSLTHERSKISIWIQSVRPFAFPASIIPVLVGTSISLYYPGNVDWFLFPIILICSMLLHGGTNMINDYYDFKKGVDKEHTYGSSRVIVEKLLLPEQVLKGGIILMIIGFILGLFLVYMRGLPMLILGIIGILGGYLYSGYPMGYKYFALGDIMVFILMGPLMVIGTYFALTGSYFSELWIMSIPVGCLVLSILEANNHRDIIHDKSANIKTVSILIGHKASKVEYVIFVSGAYLSVILMVAFSLLKVTLIIVLLALPLAIKNIKMMIKSKPDKSDEIATLDVFSAQHHLIFGVLYSIGIFAGYYL
jgi:1,4-dihydroxy-2-naphthoate octaprenyltransferase